MNAILFKALIIAIPTFMLLAGSSISFTRRKTIPNFLQLIGAGCLLIVVVTHVCEAVHLLPSMSWGQPNSVGHYLDLSCAVLALTFFPTGYLLDAFA
jgi:hypothetical protein